MDTKINALGRGFVQCNVSYFNARDIFIRQRWKSIIRINISLAKRNMFTNMNSYKII